MYRQLGQFDVPGGEQMRTGEEQDEDEDEDEDEGEGEERTCCMDMIITVPNEVGRYSDGSLFVG